MTREVIHQKIHYYLLLVLVLTLPFIPAFSSIPVVLLSLNWLLQGKFTLKWKQIAGNKYLWLFIAFYFLYAAGLLYTENLERGWEVMEKKLPLLIFPLIIGTSLPLTKKEVHHILMAFAGVCFLAGLVCLGNALYTYFTTGKDRFFYQAYSIFIHPGYFAIYLNFSLLIFLCFLNENRRNINQSIKGSLVLLIIFTLIFIQLVASKTGVAVSIVLTASFLFFLIVKSKKYALFIPLGLLGIAIIALTFYNPAVSKRFKKLHTTIEKRDNVRLQALKSGWDLYKEHPLTGVGTGDIKNELVNKYKEDHTVQKMITRKNNTHNQYLQIAIGFGTAGLLFFLLFLILPFIYALKRKEYFYPFFLLIICMYFMTEAFLEVQAGIVFFALFNTLLFFRKDLADQD